MSWYRTYRPTTIAGLHLSSVRQSLQRLLKTPQFPHALLFAGPKGTGKTSAARIISAILNDPQNEDRVSLLFSNKNSEEKNAAGELHEPDQAAEIVQRIQRGSSFAVQELDAASNRGIDDIRQLKERVYMPPQEGVVTVYILDEVHMLTNEAFNALLKMLEEPPAHVVFILATTELHKLPETVVSRTTVVRFQTATIAELASALTGILDKEKIAYDLPAIEKIAELAGGSFRDGVKLLEQAAAGKDKVSLDSLVDIFHLSAQEEFDQLVAAISQKDPQAVVALFARLRTQQVQESFFYKGWMSFLHAAVMKGVEAGSATSNNATSAPSLKIALYLLTQFYGVQLETSSPISFLGLELKSLEIVFKAKEQEKGKDGGGSGASSASAAAPKNSTTSTSTNSASASTHLPTTVTLVESYQDQQHVLDNVIPVAVVEYSEKPVQTVQGEEVVAQSGSVSAQTLLIKWDQFLLALRQKNLPLEAILRSASPTVDQLGRLRIEVFYQFHREQLEQPKSRKILDEVALQLLGGVVPFEFLLSTKSLAGAANSTVSAKVDESDQLLQLAKDILV